MNSKLEQELADVLIAQRPIIMRHVRNQVTWLTMMMETMGYEGEATEEVRAVLTDLLTPKVLQ